MRKFLSLLVYNKPKFYILTRRVVMSDYLSHQNELYLELLNEIRSLKGMINENQRIFITLDEACRYLNLSKKVTDPGTQAIFEALAQAEARQQEAIQLELFKIGATVSSLPETPDTSRPEELTELDGREREMSVLNALELAMKIQKSSFQMFAELMTHTDNPEARDILYGLAEQEMRHLLQLEKEYNNLRPRRDD